MRSLQDEAIRSLDMEQKIATKTKQQRRKWVPTIFSLHYLAIVQLPPPLVNNENILDPTCRGSYPYSHRVITFALLYWSNEGLTQPIK